MESKLQGHGWSCCICSRRGGGAATWSWAMTKSCLREGMQFDIEDFNGRDDIVVLKMIKMNLI